KDWVEGVRVVYDDEEVTYEELLDEFMVSQKPGYQRQYASVIFVDDKDEEKAARQWIKRADPAVLERRKDGLTYDVVEIEPTSAFFRAEEYHQKYWDKLKFKAFAGVLLIIGDDGPWFAPVRDELEQFRLPLGADSLSFNGVCQAILFAGMIWLLVERLLQQLDVFGGSRELRRGDLQNHHGGVRRGHRDNGPVAMPEDESVDTIASDEGSDSHRHKPRVLLSVVLFAFFMIGLFAAMGSVGFGVGAAIGGECSTMMPARRRENAHTGNMQLDTGDRSYVGAADCWEARHLRHLSNVHAQSSSRQQTPRGDLRGVVPSKSKKEDERSLEQDSLSSSDDGLGYKDDAKYSAAHIDAGSICRALFRDSIYHALKDVQANDVQAEPTNNPAAHPAAHSEPTNNAAAHSAAHLATHSAAHSATHM
ncbi:hypothetical protein THAOC_01502, partial [Thalassiosira oceanica]